MKKLITAAFIDNLEYYTPEDFNKAVEEAKEAGYTDLKIQLDSVYYDYDNNEYKRASLSGKRMETDEEYKKRLDNEKYWQDKREQEEKFEFERLSKKFLI